MIAALAAVERLDLAANRHQPRAKFVPAPINRGLISAGRFELNECPDGLAQPAAASLTPVQEIWRSCRRHESLIISGCAMLPCSW